MGHRVVGASSLQLRNKAQPIIVHGRLLPLGWQTHPISGVLPQRPTCLSGHLGPQQLQKPSLCVELGLGMGAPGPGETRPPGPA